MTFLIILGSYVFCTLITARVIGNDIHESNNEGIGEDDSYAWTLLAIIWPLLALFFGWDWWVRGAERKVTREARKAEKRRKIEVQEREKRNQERDDAMRPWNSMLRDPDASEEQKALATQVLRDLAVK
jgi:hypothetical protein